MANLPDSYLTKEETSKLNSIPDYLVRSYLVNEVGVNKALKNEIVFVKEQISILNKSLSQLIPLPSDKSILSTEKEYLVYMCKQGDLDKPGAFYLADWNGKYWVKYDDRETRDMDINQDMWIVTHYLEITRPTKHDK